MTVYARPGTEGSLMNFQARYDNYIGGEWVAPARGDTSKTPARHRADVLRGGPLRPRPILERALDAAHAAAPVWGKTSPAERAVILNKIADRIEANLESVAVAESWDNGKPIRETVNAESHRGPFSGTSRARFARRRVR